MKFVVILALLSMVSGPTWGSDNACFAVFSKGKPETKSSVLSTKYQTNGLDSDWDLYSEEFQISTTLNMRKEYRHYREAFRNGDGFMTFLLEAGVQLHAGDIIIPPLENFVELFKRKVGAAAPKLARMYVAKNKFRTIHDAKKVLTDHAGAKFYAVEYQTQVPEGLEPYRGLLPPEVFYALVADSYFPLGENLNNVFAGKLNATGLAHDLVHLYVFSKHASVLANLKTQAQKIVDQKIEVRDDAFSYYVLENLSTIDKSFVDQVFSELRIVKPFKQQYVRFQDVKKIVDRMSDEKFQSVVNDLNSVLVSQTHFAGGSTADIITVPYLNGFANKQLVWQREPFAILQKLRHMEKFPEMFNITTEESAKTAYLEKRHLLTELLVTIDGLSQLSVEDWYASMEGAGLAPYSKADIFLMESGLYANSRNWRPAIFKPSE